MHDRRFLKYCKRLASQGPVRWYGVDANYEYGDVLRCSYDVATGKLSEITPYRQFRFPRSKKRRIMDKWRRRLENFKPTREMEKLHHVVRLAA